MVRIVSKDQLETLDAYDQGRIDANERFVEILKRGIQETNRREELIAKMEEKFDFMISRITNERARDLVEEVELI